MVRTQIYLTEQEQRALQTIASRSGKSQSQLIREAVDRFIEQFQEDSRADILNAAAGLWEHREDLPDFAAVRQEAERFRPAEK